LLLCYGQEYDYLLRIHIFYATLNRLKGTMDLGLCKWKRKIKAKKQRSKKNNLQKKESSNLTWSE
jgi:hypothetical protein